MIWLSALSIVPVLVALMAVSRRYSWRLGKVTQRFKTDRLCEVRIGETRTFVHVDGWCENCLTSWWFVMPHFTRVRSDLLVAVLCRRCNAALPFDSRLRRYAEWWVARHERLSEQGESSDPREWEDIRMALRVGG